MGSSDATPSYGAIPDFRRGLVRDVGWGFLAGATCGSAFHFSRGLRRSPSGARLASAARAVRENAPRVGGRVGSLFALYFTSECAMAAARGGKQDGWNSIAAVASAEYIRSARRGPRQAAASALSWAAVVAVLEGILIVFDRKLGGRPYTPRCCRLLGDMTPPTPCLAASLPCQAASLVSPPAKELQALL